MKNIKAIVKQLIAAGVVFDLQTETPAGVVRIQQWRGNFVKLSSADGFESVQPLSGWLADAELKICVARITFLEADGTTGIEWERFGLETERDALFAKMAEQGRTLAPAEQWEQVGGAVCATVEHTNGPANYTAYIETIVIGGAA